ncbi:MAG: chromosome segregation protein SMC [Dethiobacter sp.]|nr:chromosome segregation protein SMC [Dethiobacter sp.]
MYVKKLEIHGFKSFPDKTVLELNPGITVVVGPNGCGKSNISDALRWVLGEQSARYLRGTRMDDIIFSGTSSRKPLSFAEVTVTLDNNDGTLGLDYREVSVTRRIYRNGESEYLINKRQCRLKDILEIFMDTGIGKEAYSFIGQGRVDEILNARPEERRQIFEEAAGILKYKNRKREAERRLAETAENLLRIGDIIHELSSQLGPLEEQAETARRYLVLRDRLKSGEIDLGVHEAGELRRRRHEVDERFSTAGDDLFKQQTAISRKEIELSEKQMNADVEQTAIAGMQKEIQQVSSELEKMQGKVAVTLEKIRSVERQAADAAHNLSELDAQQAKIEAERENSRLTMVRTAQGLQSAKEEQSGAERELAQLEALPEALQAASCRDGIVTVQQAMKRLQSEYDRLFVETEQYSERIVRLQDERKKRVEEILALKAKNHRLYGEKEELQQALAGIANVQSQKKAISEALILKNRGLTGQKEQEEKRVSDTRGRLRLLQELDAAMAGYYQGVKTVLSAKKQGEQGLSGIFGTVADLINVPAGYVTAVEAVLGPALQNLIAENDSVAKRAIAFLKRTRGGRATFLPLNLIEAKAAKGPSPEITGIDGYIGLASDFINAPERFHNVVTMLFSRIHLVNNLEAAVPVAKALQFRERVVTLDGDVILPGGAITGGAEKKQAGVLSRRKEAESLQQTLQSQEAGLATLVGAVEKAADEISALADELESVEEKRRQAERDLSLKENESAFMAAQLDSLEVSLAGLGREAEEISLQHEAKLSALSGTEQALYNQQDKERELQSELARLQGLLDAREQEKRSLRDRCTEYRVRLAGQQKQHEYTEGELERFDRELSVLKEKRKFREEEIKSLRSARLEQEDRVEDDREKITELEHSRSQLLDNFMAREKAYKELVTGLREEAELLRQAEKALAGVERRQNRLEIEREKLEIELDAVLGRLQDSWQLKFEEAEKLAKPLEDKAALLQDVASLKKEMAALGTVNLGAIEEYKRIFERMDFLTAQRADLEEGEKDLQRIIREIDGRMGEKFSASFEVINENFNLVFKELFGGGRSQLKLTEPENMLETGIEIVAQPPGKKLQHLSLLSGGEKALTAIALLFAFLKVKPAPFCILDEIETALDEANLVKFCNYLQRLTAQTQFVLITHRKKTMEKADILYGVTMEESGISKLISVRLNTTAENTA